MKDFTPKKVFVIVNGKYEELSYREYKRRKAADPIYADKLFVVVQDYLMGTDQEHTIQNQIFSVSLLKM